MLMASFFARAENEGLTVEKAQVEIAQTLETIEASGETGELLERLGDLYAYLGQLKGAVVAYQKAIDDFGGSAELYLKLARALLAGGRPELGLEILKIGTKAFPGSAGLHFELGKAYKGLGKHYAAISSYERALEADPENMDYRYHMADTFHMQQRWDKAGAIIDALIEEGNEDTPILLMKGQLLVALGEEEAAVRLLEEVYEANPDSPDSKRYLIYAYDQYAYKEAGSGRFDQAIESLEKAIEVDPQNLDLREKLASVYFETDDLENAEPLFKYLLEKAPDLLATYAMYGRLLQSNDRSDEAHEHFEEGLKRALEAQNETYVDLFKGLLNPN